MAIATLEKSVDVSHLGNTNRFVLIGPDYYTHVMEKIDSQNLIRPTTAEVLSFLDLALQNPDDPDSLEMLKKFKPKQPFLWKGMEKNHNPNIIELKRRFKQGYLWTCTESLPFKLPSQEGILVCNNRDGTLPKTVKGLLEFCYDKEKNKDNLVSVVEPGFKQGPMSISDLLTNRYAIAQFGGEKMLETAERVAEACYDKEAYVMGPDMSSYHKRGLTVLFSDCESDSGLYLNGRFNFVSYEGYAPGICKTA